MRLPALLLLSLPALAPLPARGQSTAQPEATPNATLPVPHLAASSARVTILENTPLRVLTSAPISTRHAREGAPLEFTLNQDVVVNNVLIIPRGADLHGVVVHTRQAGRLKGGSHLEIKLTSLDLEGRTYPLYTYRLQLDRSGKGGVTTVDTIGGAEYGALAGTVVAGDHPYASTSAKWADIGGAAALGAGAGALASAAKRGEPVTIPAESQIDFYLALPIAVTPVSAQEAARLAGRLHPAEPILKLRGETP